ncbi:hypothetical protein MY1_1287 [Nitrosarchaeum koreense MY1]|uniref:DUF4145 domain-containing protein n=1 Tax=Nitrosarchaeum koreense MY1 TaxID=1001994 RepID=F9CXS9_9ARCH|nr:hypothetical protein MY1_1287 [Nitrosarchaeum koreense MY1]
MIVPPIIHYKQEQTRIKKENDTPIRRKFLTVKEELDKAVSNAADHPEDAMGHVRTALNLSLANKFNFEKITSMKGFFNDAEKFGLPLPGYEMIYAIFNEGSKRLHEGKIHTNFEVSHAINTITNFIVELERLDIPQELIKEFKIKCKNVI